MLIRQTVRGNYRSNNLVLSDTDFGTIQSLLAGVVETYEKKAEGGVDISTPANLRGMRFGVSRPANYLSATVNLKHVKPTKHANDVFSLVNLFDGDWKSTLSATKIRQIYQGAKA